MARHARSGTATLPSMFESDAVLLALDTATDRVHLALVDAAGCHAQVLPGGAQASTTLLPAAEVLLADRGLTWAQVRGVACGLGPGAFTGLRTACSVAQGLALGLGCPTLGLNTLMAVAEDARLRQPEAVSPGQRVWVLQDARMSELYVAAFDWDGVVWTEAVAPALWPLDEPARRWAAEPGGSLVLAGSGVAVLPPETRDALMPVVRHHDAEACPSGAALGRLAQVAWARGERLDAALLLPRYVRDKVAQTTAERLQARQSA